MRAIAGLQIENAAFQTSFSETGIGRSLVVDCTMESGVQSTTYSRFMQMHGRYNKKLI